MSNNEEVLNFRIDTVPINRHADACALPCTFVINGDVRAMAVCGPWSCLMQVVTALRGAQLLYRLPTYTLYIHTCGNLGGEGVDYI
jgi:hypothetical protein